MSGSIVGGPQARTSDKAGARGRRIDDWLALAALVAIAALCLPFRFLPMTDLPQHHAMVSIFVHHDDPAYGFGERFEIDLLGRPYATVYLVGALLARVLPLDLAMRVLVTLCTLAPIAGLYALLRAAGRPRFWMLAAVPFAFGRMWYWGFLNFLLGVGLLQVGLACVIAATVEGKRARGVALGVVAAVLFFTHVHAFALLMMLAPVFAWAWSPDPRIRVALLRPLLPLAPVLAMCGVFVLTTWSHAEGFGRWRWTPLWDRTMMFDTNLAAGVPDPWPLRFLGALAVVVVAGFALARVTRDPAEPALEGPQRRQLLALGATLLVHALLYFAMPLQTPTANVVYPRQALLVALAVPTLLPALRGRALLLMRLGVAGFAALALLVHARHLRAFNREAQLFAPIFDAVPQNQRVASMIFAQTSENTSPRVSPYVQFSAYLQAYHGGDISFSFANHWNIPVQYRKSYPRHEAPRRIEWHPEMLSVTDDLPYFDYLVYRTNKPPTPFPGVEVVATSGAWTLMKNLAAVPDGTPRPARGSGAAPVTTATPLPTPGEP